MIIEEQIKIARDNWIKAASNIGFKISSPFIYFVNGEPKTAFAFLPEYGSKNGTIVAMTSSPEFITDLDILVWAKKNKCYWSFINIEACLKYNEDFFIETLNDWAKFT